MTIPTDGIAMRLYVNKCNLLNIQVADSLVNSGEYVKARELLALLAKVTEGDRLMEIDLEQRLNLLAKIEPSKPDPEVLSRYAKLHEVFDSLLNLATLDSITATPVKDLREVNPRD
jgi:thioredoxin-like negative regulator of GroEL